jgi:hypothetical protein
MTNNWVKIYTATNPIEAEIIVAMLHENGIEAVEMNKRDSSYLSFGAIEVYCPGELVVTALHLINNNGDKQE